jgi:predicted N-acyltransferase
MNIIDSASVYYAQPDGRKQVHKVGRVTRCSKKVWVQNAREVSFNAVCKVIEKSERTEKRREERRAYRAAKRQAKSL